MNTGIKKFIRRKYQKVALVAVRKVRTMVLFWARQCRKSTTLGDIAFDEMSKESGRNVIGASASLLTGSELISKALSSSDQAELVTREAEAVQATLSQSASGAGLKLACADAESGKVYNNMSADDYRDLYKSSRLEMRLYFDKTAYSRFRIIAPNPATARGWTGTVLRDEGGFTRPETERDLQIAVKPIMDTDPSFKMIYASNLPEDDRHPFFEMTLPPPDLNFPPNADGNFYRGQNGILIHRVALVDAYAAGHVLYDTREGKPLTYDQFLADPANRLGLDTSYRLIHKFGGAAAIDLLALITAQRRGVGQCATFIISSEGDFQRALAHYKALLTDGEVGVGIDVATTIGDTSNPTSVTCTERTGNEFFDRAVFVWKEREPKIARDRFKRILGVRKPRRACIDATNEQYFARETALELGSVCPWELVDARNKVEPVPPGYERDPIYKTWLGDLYCAAMNGNRHSCPPDEYFKDDHRMPIKSGGVYSCEPDKDGKHGDTFDSGKLAQFALTSDRGNSMACVFPDSRMDQILANRRERTVFG